MFDIKQLLNGLRKVLPNISGDDEEGVQPVGGGEFPDIFRRDRPILAGTSIPNSGNNTAAVDGVRGPQGWMNWGGTNAEPLFSDSTLINLNEPYGAYQPPGRTVPKSPYQQSEDDLIAAISAPIKKEKWWKDALYKGGSILSNIYQGGWGDEDKQIPVVGYGRAKHDQNVADAIAKYTPQRQIEENRQKDIERQSRIENIDADNDRLAAELERKRAADAARVVNWKELLKDKARGRELQKEQVDSLKAARAQQVKIAEQANANNSERIKIEKERAKAYIREIDEKLKDKDLDRELKEKTSILNREESRKRAQERLEGADARTKASYIDKVVLEWIKQNPDATPAEIAQVRKELQENYQR